MQSSFDIDKIAYGISEFASSTVLIGTVCLQILAVETPKKASSWRIPRLEQIEKVCKSAQINAISRISRTLSLMWRGSNKHGQGYFPLKRSLQGRNDGSTPKEHVDKSIWHSMYDYVTMYDIQHTIIISILWPFLTFRNSVIHATSDLFKVRPGFVTCPSVITVIIICSF